MSSCVRRYQDAVYELEDAGLELVCTAQTFNPQGIRGRVVQTRDLFRASRRYAAAVRRLGRLRA